MNDRHGEHGLGDAHRLDEAWEFVIEHQGAQDRKGTSIPYTTHLRGVARRVLADGGTVDEAIGGLLHDVVEDTPVLDDGHSVELAEIQERFGPRVAEVVGFCTDTEPGSRESKPPWRPRKEGHFEQLLPADAGILRVVAADKTDNITGQLADFESCRDDPAALAESLARFKGGLAGTLWYYRGMRAAMGDKLADSALYEELTDKILELATLRSPEPEERARVVGSRMVLDALDPCGVGPVAVANGYYAVDADELARRASVPAAMPVRDTVHELATKWYGDGAWRDPSIDKVAEALR